MWVANGILNAAAAMSPTPTSPLTGPKAQLAGVLLDPSQAAELLTDQQVDTDGDASALEALAAVMGPFTADFKLSTA